MGRSFAKSHMKIPSRTCQNFTSATVKNNSMDCLGPHGAMPDSAVRTEIFFNDSGISEVYHLGKQVNEAEFGW